MFSWYVREPQYRRHSLLSRNACNVKMQEHWTEFSEHNNFKKLLCLCTYIVLSKRVLNSVDFHDALALWYIPEEAFYSIIKKIQCNCMDLSKLPKDTRTWRWRDMATLIHTIHWRRKQLKNSTLRKSSMHLQNTYKIQIPYSCDCIPSAQLQL